MASKNDARAAGAGAATSSSSSSEPESEPRPAPGPHQLPRSVLELLQLVDGPRHQVEEGEDGAEGVQG